jgi:hypothetical protein
MILPILVALLTLVVVATGALATTASSLADPEGVLFYAVLHRQAGEFGGAAILAILVWISFSQPKLRSMAAALCVGAMAQGVLGAMPLESGVGVLHSLLAQVLLAGTLALVVAVSPGYTQAPQLIADYGWPSLRSLSIFLPLLISIQVALGAAFRHRLLGLMPHVIGAVLTTMFVLIVGSFVLQQCKDHRILAGFGRVMMVMTFVQVFLGLAIFTVRSMPPPQEPSAILAIATAHVLTGGLLLAASAVLGMHIRRNVTPKGA